jgi:hypothetical protein
MFGGADATRYLVSDTWQLSLDDHPSWSRLQTAGDVPATTWCGIYDPLRDRMIVVGINLDLSHPRDVWALSLGTVPEWTALGATGNTLPVPASGCLRFEADRMVIFGGLRVPIAGWLSAT